MPSSFLPPRIHNVVEFNWILAADPLFMVISCVLVHWEFLKVMHESSKGFLPPQIIGVGGEPRSPPTAYSLLDGMSPNGDEDEFKSMTSVARSFPSVTPPTIKNRLSENRKYYYKFFELYVTQILCPGQFA